MAPLHISKDLALSHLFYADDVFIFGKASNSNLLSILSILKLFGDLSGLRLNELKSHVIFPKKMSYPVRMGVVRNTCFRFSSSFGKYLGVLISPLRLKKADYFSILDKT